MIPITLFDSIQITFSKETDIMRLMFRFLGLTSCSVGAAQFGYDVIYALEEAGLQLWQHRFTDLGSVWFAVHPSSLQAIQPIIQRYIHPIVWDPAIQWMLLQPSFVIFSVFGIALMITTRQKQRKIWLNSRRFSSID